MHVTNSSQRIASWAVIGLLTPCAFTLFQRIFCQVTSSLCGPVSMPTLVLVASASTIAYTVFSDREDLIKICLLAKKHFQYDAALIAAADSNFRILLSEEIGKAWLNIHSFTLNEGVKYLHQVCIIDKGTCDGAVLAFLHLASMNPQMSDLELERAIRPIDEIIYQAKREIKVDVRNFVERDMFGYRFEHINHTDYDPYSAFSKPILELHTKDNSYLSEEVSRIVQNHAVVVGRINLSGGDQVLAHAIAIQCSHNRYRFRDGLIYSFSSLQELLANFYKYVKKQYLHTYDMVEIRLWAFPLLPQ
jgi:hypothetical protein